MAKVVWRLCLAVAALSINDDGALQCAETFTSDVIAKLVRESKSVECRQRLWASSKEQEKEWRNNTLGITSDVPPPWRPLEMTGGKVACWGREYDIRSAILLNQVRSAGENLLESPVSLKVAISQKEYDVTRAHEQKIEHSPNEIRIASRASVPGLAISVKSTIEYDGCMRAELTLLPEQSTVEVDRLEIRIPFSKSRATYYHWFSFPRRAVAPNSGLMPRTGLSAGFRPFLWLGDNARGFCWFAESPQGWAVSKGTPVLRVENADRATVLRVIMANERTEIKGKWKTVFGLMATPSRPFPMNWRSYYTGHNVTKFFIAWSPGFFHFATPWSDSGTMIPQTVRNFVEICHTKGHPPGIPASYIPFEETVKVIPYAMSRFYAVKYDSPEEKPPMIDLYGDEWVVNTERTTFGRRHYHTACPGSSFAEYFMWKLNWLIEELSLDGIYLDGVFWPCGNRDHGCGYADASGRWHPEYKIWAWRELYKRVYCLLHEKVENPLVIHHCSSWLMAPVISFAHFYLDGEQFIDVGREVHESYLKVTPLDVWRAELMGRQWGPAPMFLPQLRPPAVGLKKANRELLALVNLHDVNLRGVSGLDKKMAAQNYVRKRLFGVDDCEFRGYWRAADWIRCRSQDGYVSVYRKPDIGKCLLIVANLGRTGRTIEVQLMPALAVTSQKARDLETGRTYRIINRVISVPTEARDFHLVAVH